MKYIHRVESTNARMGVPVLKRATRLGKYFGLYDGGCLPFWLMVNKHTLSYIKAIYLT